MEGLATKIIVGIIIAATSAWITVRLSLSRFRTEKWWERKIEAYTKIFEAFHHLKSFSDKHIYAGMHGRDIPKEVDDELRRESKSAHKEIGKFTDIGAFIFSDEFYQRLKKYQKDAEETAEKSHGWVDYLMNDQEVTEDCLNDLIKLAKYDLGKNIHKT